jgi:hypothetical protein
MKFGIKKSPLKVKKDCGRYNVSDPRNTSVTRLVGNVNRENFIQSRNLGMGASTFYWHFARPLSLWEVRSYTG